MHTLFLDLASHSGLLACVADDRVIASDPIDHRIDDAALVPQLEDLLSMAGWSYTDLTNIACVVGPGGFTSLRVAVALANAVSHELNIPSCGIHLSDVYLARLPPPPAPPSPRPSPTAVGEGDFVWVHSTKKNELFIRGFGDLQQQFPEPVCITTDALRTWAVGIVRERSLQWMGELIPEQRKIADEAGLEEILLKPLGDVLPPFLHSQTYRKQILVPWYGRGW